MASHLPRQCAGSMASHLLWQSVLLLGMALQSLHADTNYHVGPKLPGDPKFCVDLEALGMSEGTMTPEFEKTKTNPGAVYATSNYKLIINDEKATTLLITPQLQLSKYNLLKKPLLKFNGQNLEWSPLETLQIPVVLNESFAEFHQTITLEVLDPRPPGLFQTQRGHRYNIDVRQKPDIEEIVRPLDIEVYDQDWVKIPSDPPFDPDTIGKRVEFMIPDKARSLRVKLLCHSEATSISYGGIQQPLGSTFDVDMDEPTASVLVQCQYKNELWTQNSIYDRTYVVSLTRNAGDVVLNETKVGLLVWPPEDGACEEEGTGTATPSFECGVRTSAEVSIIATYNNPKAMLELVDKVDDERYRMYNGLPTKISLGKQYQLELKAGKHTPYFFPVAFVGVATCNTLACGDKFELLPNAENRPCKRQVCTLENDFDYCCQRHRASCLEVKCPNTTKQRACASELQCAWDPCTEKDVRKCCADQEHPLRYCPTQWVYEYEHPELFKKFTCGAFQCPEGFVQKLGAKSIFCQEQPCNIEVDRTTCCDEELSCDSMKCGVGWTQKFNAAIFACKSRTCDSEFDHEICCTEAAYCDTFSCPPSWLDKPNKALISCAGMPCQWGDTSTCCSMEGMCDTYTSCPKGTHLREDAYRTQCSGFARGVCDSPLDELICCAESQACSDFRCPPGWAIKAQPENFFCAGKACDVMDNSICCDVVNPFQAGKLSMVPRVGDGECSAALDNMYDFHCKANYGILHSTLVVDFDGPVQDGVFIGGIGLGNVPIQGKTALLAIPNIDATNRGKVHGTLLAHVPGHPSVRKSLSILVSPNNSSSVIERQQRRLGSDGEERLLWQ